MGGVKTLMGLGDGSVILWIVVLPLFPDGLRESVKVHWDFGHKSNYDQNGENTGIWIIPVIARGLGQKYLFFERLKCYLPMFYGAEIIKCKKSANIFIYDQNPLNYGHKSKMSWDFSAIFIV